MGPTGLGTFAVLLLLFVASQVALTRWRRLPLKLLAGVAAAVVGLASGALAVNRYFGYYDTWEALYRDTAGPGEGRAVTLPATLPPPAVDAPPATARPGSGLSPGDGGHGGRPVLLPPPAGSDRRLLPLKPPVAGKGLLLNTDIPGPLSGLRRDALVYLPAQYFTTASHEDLPVVEFLHGSPGRPSDVVLGVHADEALQSLVDAGTVPPAILVIPHPELGPSNKSDECVDVPGGPAWDTYLALDVPAVVHAYFRALPPGPGWAIAGFSTGGWCAANAALRHPGSYGALGSLDGYFRPLLGSSYVRPGLFSRSVRTANSPLQRIAAVPPGLLPATFLASGTGRGDDPAADGELARALRLRTPDLPLEVVRVPGQGHVFPAWRRTTPALLTFLLQHLAPPAPTS